MIEQIKKDYPLTYKKMVEHIKIINEGAQKELQTMQDADFYKMFLGQITEEQSLSMLLSTPRATMEFFDDNGIYLGIGYANDSFEFNVKSEDLYDRGFDTRLEAEIAGLKQCFKVMEKQLKDDTTKSNT